MKKEFRYIEWWRSTALHMWRSYFEMQRATSSPPRTDADMRIFIVCDDIFRTRFVQRDQDVIRMYFTSNWKNDLHAVEDYSLKHNVPVSVIWNIIKRANRMVIEEIGLLDKKSNITSDNGTEAGNP